MISLNSCLCLQAWSDVTPLTFIESQSLADIEILFGAYNHGDNEPFDGPGNTLAHAYFPGDGIMGDVHFDESETWTVGQSEGQCTSETCRVYLVLYSGISPFLTRLLLLKFIH